MERPKTAKLTLGTLGPEREGGLVVGLRRWVPARGRGLGSAVPPERWASRAGCWGPKFQSPEAEETVSVVPRLPARPQGRLSAPNPAPPTAHHHHPLRSRLPPAPRPLLSPGAPLPHAGSAPSPLSCLFSLLAVATTRDAEIRKDVQVLAVGPMAAVEPQLSGSFRPLEARPGPPGSLGWGRAKSGLRAL